LTRRALCPIPHHSRSCCAVARRGRGTLTRLRPLPNTRRETSRVAAPGQSSHEHSLPNTRSSFAPDYRLLRSLRLRAGGLQRLATARRAAAARHAARCASRAPVLGWRPSALSALGRLPPLAIRLPLYACLWHPLYTPPTTRRSRRDEVDYHRAPTMDGDRRSTPATPVEHSLSSPPRLSRVAAVQGSARRVLDEFLLEVERKRLCFSFLYCYIV
jgi:hypothetical protein